MINCCKPDAAEGAANDFEELLQRCQTGCTEAQSELVEYVHQDFYLIARRLCAGKPYAQSLHATRLVNEAFLRLFKRRVFQRAPSARFLFAAAGKTMRNVIADYVREKKSMKRSPVGGKVMLERVVDQLQSQSFSFDDLNEALEALEKQAARRAEIVHMRYFLGMTVKETADALCVSESTVEKEWRQARVWLYQRLH